MSIRLPPKRYDAIQAHVNRFMREYSTLSFPLDIYDIVLKMPDVELRLYSSLQQDERNLLMLLSEEGFTQLRHETYVIWINDSIREKRQDSPLHMK